MGDWDPGSVHQDPNFAQTATYLLVSLSTLAYGLLEYYRTKAKRAEHQDDK